METERKERRDETFGRAVIDNVSGRKRKYDQVSELSEPESEVEHNNPSTTIAGLLDEDDEEAMLILLMLLTSNLLHVTKK
eukprot:scaffold7232_cov310-Ochromonas_danica.AAC.10